MGTGFGMRIEDLRVFTVFAKHMNFSKAAAELNITQPTLSKRIAAIENELGVQLVARTRPLQLTSAGSSFLLTCQHIWHFAENELRLFRAQAHRVPPVRLSGFDFVPVGAFLASIDDIDVSFNPCTGEEGYFSILENGEADVNVTYDVSEVALLANRARKLGVEVLRIGYVPGAIMLMSSNPLASKDGLRRSELGGVGFVVPGRGPFDDWSLCISHYLGSNTVVNPILRSVDGNLHNLDRMNLGDAVFLMSKDIVDRVQANRSDVKVFYELDDEPILFPVAILYKRDNPSPSVKTFIERARSFFDSKSVLVEA